MSLDFDFSQTAYLNEDHPGELWIDASTPDNPGGQALRPEADYIVWAAMLIGVPVITDKTVEQFIARCSLWEQVKGPIVGRRGTDGTVTSAFNEAAIRRCVGFRSNANVKTKTAFLRMVFEGRLDKM